MSPEQQHPKKYDSELHDPTVLEKNTREPVSPTGSAAGSVDSQFSNMSLNDLVRGTTPPDMHPDNPTEEQASGSGHKEPKTGYIDCLTTEQEAKLMELWALIIELLSVEESRESWVMGEVSGGRSKSSSSDRKKQQQLAEVLSKNASTHSIDSITSTSSTRTQMMNEHPLTEEFWHQLATDDPDVLLLRFLRARKWNVLDAFFMFFEALKWRRAFGVHDMLKKGDVKAVKRELLDGGKGYFYGYDHDGRLIVILPARKHDRYAQTLEENMAHTVMLMETGRRMMRPGVETVTLLFDLADAPLSSFDPGSMQFMIECFQSYYPESLGRCYVINAPWIFWGFWRMIKIWLDPVVAAKIFFLEDHKRELLQYIPEEMLVKDFGGAADYQFKFHPPSDDGCHYPKPLDRHEEKAINEAIAHEKTRLIDATLHLHSLLNNPSHLFARAEPVLDARELTEKWRSERKMIITKLRSLLQVVDLATVPPHMYKRLGVVQPDGSMEWERLCDV